MLIFAEALDVAAEGAVWYADVPHGHCVRVREGGEVLDVEVSATKKLNLDRLLETIGVIHQPLSFLLYDRPAVILVSLLVPAAIGYAIVGTWQGALTALLWGGFVATAALVDTYEAFFDMNELADRKTRFAMVMMGALNAVNVILGTSQYADGRHFEGTYLIAGGGTAQVTISNGVAWTFTEVR